MEACNITGSTKLVGCPFRTGSFFLVVFAFLATGAGSASDSDSGETLRFEVDAERLGGMAGKMWVCREKMREMVVRRSAGVIKRVVVYR